MNIILVSTNFLEIIELEVEKLSLYIDISDGKNMDSIFVSFSIDKVIKRISYITNYCG